MSRGFFGGTGGGDGSKRPGAAKDSLTGKKSLSKTLSMGRRRKMTMNEMVAERTSSKVKNYSEIVEDLLDEKMTQTGRPSYFFIPGTTPPEEKKLSKGREAAIEHFKMKRMKERLNTREQKVEVQPKNYTGGSGGWIDKRGKIRNAHGRIVMEVNLNTGVITNRMGMKVGRYNPGSSTNDFKIQRLIHRYDEHHARFNPFAPKE